jgi:hypothetical protein
MFKPKTTNTGRLENSSGDWIRTNDLRVMSPTSCLCSTPHQWSKLYHFTLIRQGQPLRSQNQGAASLAVTH